MLQNGDWLVPHARRRRPSVDRAAALLRHGGAAATALSAAPARCTTPRGSPPRACLALTLWLLALAGARALWPSLPLAAGADVHRLRRPLGPRAPAVARHRRARRRCARRFTASRWRRAAPIVGGVVAGRSACGVAFLSQGFMAAAVARSSLRSSLLRLFASLAHARYAADARHRAARRAPLAASPGRWPLYLRDPGLVRAVAGGADRRPLSSASTAGFAARPSRFTISRTCRGSRGRRCRWRCGCCGLADAASMAGLRSPAWQLPAAR